VVKKLLRRYGSSYTSKDGYTWRFSPWKVNRLSLGARTRRAPDTHRRGRDVG
jgi:hypothetical protein